MRRLRILVAAALVVATASANGQVVPTCDLSIGASTLAIYAVYEMGSRPAIHYYYLSTEVDTNIACSLGQSDRCQWGLAETLYELYNGDYMRIGLLNFHTSLSCNQSELSSTGKVGWGIELAGQYKVVAVETCYEQTATAQTTFTLR